MKLSFGKRALMFFHWLLSLLFVAAFAVYVIVPDFALDLYHRAENLVGPLYIKIIAGALLLIFACFSIAQLCLVFKRKKREERGFITMDSSETGRSRIAVSAIEQMVRQSVYDIDGISDMKISIDNKDDAIMIGVVASIVNGSHVPTLTMNMQQAIRHFVETNCGVAVRNVSVSIDSVTSPAEATRRWRRNRLESERKSEKKFAAESKTYAPPVPPVRTETDYPSYTPPAPEPEAPKSEEPAPQPQAESAAPTFAEELLAYKADNEDMPIQFTDKPVLTLGDAYENGDAPEDADELE